MDQSTATIEPATIERPDLLTAAAVRLAQGHIRTALRIGKNVEITLRAHDGSDDYDLPNDGTAIVETLTLALTELAAVSSWQEGATS